MEHKLASFLIRFLIRSILGMGLIFFINQYVLPSDTSLNVGMNAFSFLTSGTLGIPGVCLLYGMLIFKNL